MKNELKKVCPYFALIEKYLLTLNEVENIKITKLNAAKGGFGQIHYGNLFSIVIFLQAINLNNEVAIKE